MTTADEYGTALRDAQRELAGAATAEDVRAVWRKHIGALGHRALGRLLMGRSADELLARRGSKADSE